MKLETCNSELFTSRLYNSDGQRYIEIRAKLLIKRLLCKIIYLRKRNLINLNFFGTEGVFYKNGKWQAMNPPPMAAGVKLQIIDPISLLCIGVSEIVPIEDAIVARLGLKVRDSLWRGLYKSSCSTVSHHCILFWNIGRHIRSLVTTDGYYYYDSQIEEYLIKEWERLNNKSSEI